MRSTVTTDVVVWPLPLPVRVRTPAGILYTDWFRVWKVLGRDRGNVHHDSVQPSDVRGLEISTGVFHRRNSDLR